MGSTSTTEVYDLLILVDATGSMGNYLQSLRQSLPQIISLSALTNCFERIGLIAYRDYCDRDLIQWSGWAEPAKPKQGQPDLVDIASRLAATGGGDAPEATKTGLWTAYKNMRSEAMTLILLYTDAPPHMFWDDHRNSNAQKERNALNHTRTGGEYGSLFADWASAAHTLQEGAKKAQVICILDEWFSGRRSGQYEFLSTITRGATLRARNKPANISELTVAVLLAFMGVRKAGAESVPLHATLSQYANARAITAIRNEKDKQAHSFFQTNSRGNDIDTVSLDVTQEVLDAHLPKRATPLQDLAKSYKESQAYREIAVRNLQDIIERDVSAISLNPVFGSLWRMFCNHRENDSRQAILDLFGSKIEQLQDGEEKTRMKTWLEESYDYTADVLEAIHEVPRQERFPCVCLDPTLAFARPDRNGEENDIDDRAITSFRRDELLEIGRSCDWRILRRLGRVLTRLTFIESAEQMPAHIAVTSEADVPRIPTALASAVYGRKFWRLLLHIVVPGTMLSARPAALLAALSIKLGVHPLLVPAVQEMLLWRDRWNDIEIPETWNVNCLSLLLDADKAYQDGHSVMEGSSVSEGLLSEKDRSLFARLIDYKMLELNLNTTLTATVGWTPNKTTMPIGPIIRCKVCEYPRSVTIMGPDNVCGMCLCNDFEDADSKKSAVTTRVSKADNENTRAVWYECAVQTCRAQYIVYCVERLNVRPKCHYCRLQGTVDAEAKHLYEAPVVECTSCLSRMIWPTEYRPTEGCIGWICVACTAGIKTQVDIETTPNELKEENGMEWLLRNDNRKLAKPFDNRTLYHTASHVGTLDEFAEKVHILPSRGQQLIPLFYHGKLIRNNADLLEQLYKWISRRRTEAGTCSLCFSNTRKADLLLACGRTGCPQQVCRRCLEGWYGLNAAGRIINTAALSCPFCRRAPTAKTLARYGMGIHAVAGLKEAVDQSGAWIYAWCADCGYAKPYLERVCAAGAPPDLHNWICDGCQETRIHAKGGSMERIKACPSCATPTQKLSGCDHIQCTAIGSNGRTCGVHWCFFCSKQCDENTIYDHMNTEHGGLYAGGEGDEMDYEDYEYE